MSPKTGDLVKNRKNSIGLVMWTQICYFDGWDAEMCFVLWPGLTEPKQVDPLGLEVVSYG
jgi:hypothetical protein